MAGAWLSQRGRDLYEHSWSVQENLRVVYGEEFVHFLASVYLGLKGFNYNLIGQLTLPVFQQLGVSGNDYQLASMVAMMPWSTKGWIGVLSDCFPLGRYHKQGYLLASSVAGLAGLIGLLVLTYFAHDQAYQWPVAGFFFLVHLQASTFDLLAEGKYAEVMRTTGAGSEVISLVWMCFNGGCMVAAMAIFLFLSAFGVFPLLVVTVVPMVHVTWLSYRRALPEEPAKSRRHLRLKLLSQPRLFMLATWMVLGVLGITWAVAQGSAKTAVAITTAVTIALSVASFFALPWVLALSNIYMMVSRAMSLDLSGPLSYFYTAGPNCVPDGPGFSDSYYLGTSTMVGALAGILGSALFHFISDWTFCRAFQLTTFVSILASMFDIVIINRWNRDVGISDQAAYLFGDAAVQQIAQMLSLMPAVLLTSRLCPRGAEATVYSILAGFQNFGASISSVLGVWLSSHLEIDTRGAVDPRQTCDFANLSNAVIVAHAVIPFMSIPLARFMVPLVSMEDEAAFLEAAPDRVPSFCSPTSSSPHSTPSPSRFWSGGSRESDGLSSDAEGYHHLAGSPPGEEGLDDCDFVLTGLRQAPSTEACTDLVSQSKAS